MHPSDIQRQIDGIIQQLVQLREQVAEDGGVLPADAIQKLKDRICLNCGEPIPRSTSPVRGCHPSCRKAVKRQIDAGILTDVQAINRGMWAPPNVSGRPPRRDTKVGQFVAEAEQSELAQAKVEIDAITRKAVASRPKKAVKKKASRKKN
jgi:hypothetical protein